VWRTGRWTDERRPAVYRVKWITNAVFADILGGLIDLFGKWLILCMKSKIAWMGQFVTSCSYNKHHSYESSPAQNMIEFDNPGMGRGLYCSSVAGCSSVCQFCSWLGPLAKCFGWILTPRSILINAQKRLSNSCSLQQQPWCPLWSKLLVPCSAVP